MASPCISCQHYSDNLDWETRLCDSCAGDLEDIMEGLWLHLSRNDFSSAAACFRLAVNRVKQEHEGR